MIKTLKPILIVLFLVVGIVAIFLSMSTKQNMITLFEGNIEKKPIDIILNHFQDSDCGMVIDKIDYASQVIAPDGKTWFFHDHGGMVKWLETKPFKDKAIIWVHSLDTNKWIDAREAYYTRDEETPMKYGFGAYSKNSTNRIPFKEMQLLMLRGETMANPTIRRQLLKSKEKESHGDH